MKNLCIVFILFFLFSINSKAAVQTYTFSQTCVSTNWLVINGLGTECEYDDIDFMGQIFNLVLVNKSIQTDMNNIVTSGNRYFFFRRSNTAN